MSECLENSCPNINTKCEECPHCVNQETCKHNWVYSPIGLICNICALDLDSYIKNINSQLQAAEEKIEKLNMDIERYKTAAKAYEKIGDDRLLEIVEYRNRKCKDCKFLCHIPEFKIFEPSLEKDKICAMTLMQMCDAFADYLNYRSNQ